MSKKIWQLVNIKKEKIVSKKEYKDLLKLCNILSIKNLKQKDKLERVKDIATDFEQYNNTGFLQLLLKILEE